MMKKILSAIFLMAALQTTPAQAGLFGWNNGGCGDCCNECGTKFSVEARFSAFTPVNRKHFHHVYRHVAYPCFDIEASMNVWSCLQGFVNAGYIWTDGHSHISDGETRLRHRTNFQLVPLTFGLKWVQPLTCDLDVYFGAGAAYSWLMIRDHSDFVHRHVNKQNWGAVAKLGFLWHYNDCIYFDGFLDYYWTKFNFRTRPNEEPFVLRNNLNINALKFGVGVGYNF